LGERLEEVPVNSIGSYLRCYCLFWDGGAFGGSTRVGYLNPELYKNLFDNSGAESIIYQVFRMEGNIFHLFAQLFI